MSKRLAVYLAAPQQLRLLAQALKAVLEREGFEVTSTWLRGDVLDDEQAAATIDHLGDIDRSDALVLLNPEEFRDSGTGGRHFEAGYAYKGGKAVFVVGVRTQAFHYRPNMQIVRTPDLLVPALKMRELLVETARLRSVEGA